MACVGRRELKAVQVWEVCLIGSRRLVITFVRPIHKLFRQLSRGVILCSCFNRFQWTLQLWTCPSRSHTVVLPSSLFAHR